TIPVNVAAASQVPRLHPDRSKKAPGRTGRQRRISERSRFVTTFRRFANMPIRPLSARMRQYIAAFDVAAIAQYDARLIVTRNPQQADAAWWFPARHIKRVIARARLMGDDVEAAAAVLGIRATPHADMVARVDQALAKMDRRLADARAAGAIKFLNAEYRRR